MGNGNGTGSRFVGVDVGGTKIQASLVAESGAIQARERRASPRRGQAQTVLAAVARVINALLEDQGVKRGSLAAIGIAVPGVVDPKRGQVVVTPNMKLTGASVGPWLEEQYGVPVAVGNDCNLGALGEKWLGAARGSSSSFSMLVGTGIGGGFVRKGRLWEGYRNAAGEVGHMVIQVDGPRCACGNRGCLEALASRTAIERQVRASVKAGRKTMLTKLLDGNLRLIRSGALRQALDGHDPLVTEILRRASEVLGQACVAVYHLVDPEVIVLGGGVIEACGDFMIPIIQKIVSGSRLPGTRDGGGVFLSALGDDAVVLGAIALARMHVGRSPFKKKYTLAPRYRKLACSDDGLVVGNRVYRRDICIRVSGKVAKRKRVQAKKLYGTTDKIGTSEVARVCRGGPEVLFVGTGKRGKKELTGEAEGYLRRRAIEYHTMPTTEAIEAYNKSRRRKAALLQVAR